MIHRITKNFRTTHPLKRQQRSNLCQLTDCNVSVLQLFLQQTEGLGFPWHLQDITGWSPQRGKVISLKEYSHRNIFTNTTSTQWKFRNAKNCLKRELNGKFQKENVPLALKIFNFTYLKGADFDHLYGCCKTEISTKLSRKTFLRILKRERKNKQRLLLYPACHWWAIRPCQEKGNKLVISKRYKKHTWN